MFLKMYKNNFCINPTSIFTWSLKGFSFYFHQKCISTTSTVFFKVRNLKIFPIENFRSHLQKIDETRDHIDILKCNYVSAMLMFSDLKKSSSLNYNNPK